MNSECLEETVKKEIQRVSKGHWQPTSRGSFSRELDKREKKEANVSSLGKLTCNVVADSPVEFRTTDSTQQLPREVLAKEGNLHFAGRNNRVHGEFYKIVG
ncbi:hypothetical protein K0M31_019672 [Melipona bicolor]|uniref:Uncharacterized protein n=1 Tax=Melipona bicolor TaxID=60889 RepID=A0AA40G2Q7_9HYME|nr:hypothetical protein K0M31_019672 [Melipona bicolor]